MYSTGTTPRSNGPAVTSLVTGLLGWLVYILGFFLDALVGAATAGIGTLCLAPLDCVPPILWLVAIVTGHIALTRVRHAGAGGRQQAITGLVAGYLGLGILLALTLLIVFLLVSGVGLGWLAHYLPITLPGNKVSF